MIFSYGLTYSISVCAGWEVSELFLLVLAVVHGGILYGRKLLKRKNVPVDSCLVALALAGAAILVLWEPAREYPVKIVRAYMEWGFTGKLEMSYGFLLLYLMLLVGACLYQRMAARVEAKLLLSVGILGFLIWQACIEASFHLLPTAALLFVCLDGMTAGYQQFVLKKKLRTGDMLPFVLLTVFLVAIVPVSDKPVSWDGVKNFWGNAKESVNEFLAGIVYGEEENEFGVGTIGFSQDSDSFWGRLVDGGKREMLRVSAYTGAGTEARYFAGIVKDTYEQDVWLVEEEAEGVWDFTKQEIWEHLCYLYYAGLPQNESERFCQNHTYGVQYENLKTNVVFYPDNTYRVKFDKNLTADEKFGRGDGYELSSLSMNLKNEKLVQYLKRVTACESTAEVWELLETEYAPDTKESLFAECVKRMGISEEELEDFFAVDWKAKLTENEEEIRKKDLQLPENISPKIQTLALDLTENETNDYDKVQAIVRYLKKEGGFTYSTVPTGLPEGEDALEYFLLESKEGYCTYYATALTLLCRLSGIPARYVEGVMVDYEQEEDGWYPVWGADSHAWTQVYLKGFGWMDVDATPGSGMGRGNWQNQGAVYQQQGERPPQTDTQEAGLENPSEEQTEEAENWRERLSYLGIVLGMIVLCVLLVMLITKGISFLNYKRAGTRKQAELLMRRLFYTLKKREAGIEEGETLRMYQKRLAKKEEEADAYWEIFSWYEGVRYGGHIVTKQEVRNLEEICKRERKRTGRERMQRFLKAGRKRKRK